LELMQDAYGNYVVQYVLDVCSDDDVAAVCESVVGRVNLLAIQKFSSNVMEKCLERCSDRVKEHYLAEMSDPDRIRELMMDPFGNYVVQRALSVATHAQAIRLVEAMKPHLLATQASGPHGQRSGGVRNTAGGRRIIAKICRRFPNFTLSSVASNEEIYSSGRAAHRHHPPPMMQSSYAPIGPTTSLPQSHSQQFAVDPFAGDPFSAEATATAASQAYNFCVLPPEGNSELLSLYL
jgi:Pumilio-family RNA binding repeat